MRGRLARLFSRWIRLLTMNGACAGATLAHPPTGDEQKAFNGSCIVARAAIKEEVMEKIKKGIYATSGCGISTRS